jgi:hypothetical protein
VQVHHYPDKTCMYRCQLRKRHRLLLACLRDMATLTQQGTRSSRHAQEYNIKEAREVSVLPPFIKLLKNKLMLQYVFETS